MYQLTREPAENLALWLRHKKCPAPRRAGPLEERRVDRFLPLLTLVWNTSIIFTANTAKHSVVAALNKAW